MIDIDKDIGTYHKLWKRADYVCRLYQSSETVEGHTWPQHAGKAIEDLRETLDRLEPHVGEAQG